MKLILVMGKNENKIANTIGDYLRQYAVHTMPEELVHTLKRQLCLTCIDCDIS